MIVATREVVGFVCSRLHQIDTGGREFLTQHVMDLARKSWDDVSDADLLRALTSAEATGRKFSPYDNPIAWLRSYAGANQRRRGRQMIHGRP
jgi:hypothetical protein